MPSLGVKLPFGAPSFGRSRTDTVQGTRWTAVSQSLPFGTSTQVDPATSGFAHVLCLTRLALRSSMTYSSIRRAVHVGLLSTRTQRSGLQSR